MRLPLQIYNPRPKCWQVNLQFGPHCFTLFEYETEKVARGAMSSVESNWKIFESEKLGERHDKRNRKILRDNRPRT
jgi:hypothetical protein